MNHKKTILVTSNEPWSDVWFSKHFYAVELAQMGFQVYFLNAPRKWRLRNLIFIDFKTEEIQKNLSIINYNNRFPIRFIKSLFIRLNDVINCFTLKRKLNLSDELIWWKFDPFRFVTTPFLKGSFSIYHITDQFYHIKTDMELARLANKIICTSFPHYEHYESYFNQKVMFIPHGISASQIRYSNKTISQPFDVLLIGTMNDDYDLRLLDQIGDIDDFRLTIIGPTSFKRIENKQLFYRIVEKEKVNYLGRQNASLLKNFISESDICISPYRFDMKRIGSSLKILNYLGCAKPVVTSVLEGFQEMEGKGVYFAQSEEEFIEYLHQISKGNIEMDLNKLNNFLNKRDYKKLISKILESVEA